MKRSIIITAALFLFLAPLAQATLPIMKAANEKKPGYKCETCHSAKPASKANLTEEGKKFIPKK